MFQFCIGAECPRACRQGGMGPWHLSGSGRGTAEVLGDTGHARGGFPPTLGAAPEPGQPWSRGRGSHKFAHWEADSNPVLLVLVN